MIFTDSLRSQGVVRTKESAGISAHVPGLIEDLQVDEGDCVKKGDLLFRVDRKNLENAVRAAKDDLVLVRARLVQAEATAEKANLDAERMKRLYKGAAVTKDVLEKAEVGAKSATAALDAARAAIAKAETGLAVAEKNLSDSCVVAPFDGVIIKKHKQPGDYAAPGTKVFELENPGRLELALLLNAARFAQVRVGTTKVRLDNALDGKNEFVISYRSPTVSQLTRTFEVRCELPRTEAVAPGMLLDGQVVFETHTGVGVPAAAVANRGGTDCIFIVVDGKVVRRPVETGFETDGWREIRTPTIGADEQVILEGMLLVNEGDEVRVKK